MLCADSLFILCLSDTAVNFEGVPARRPPKNPASRCWRFTGRTGPPLAHPWCRISNVRLLGVYHSLTGASSRPVLDWLLACYANIPSLMPVGLRNAAPSLHLLRPAIRVESPGAQVRIAASFIRCATDPCSNDPHDDRVHRRLSSTAAISPLTGPIVPSPRAAGAARP